MGFQVTTSKFLLDRANHIWHFRGTRDYKCVLCGALAARPPEQKDDKWVADYYEPLTTEDRAHCPYTGGRILD